MPYNSKELAFAAKSSTCAAAPLFAIAIAIAQIARLGHVVNGCLFVFVFSAANSDLNIASRTLYDIAVDKKAPKIFTKTNKAGVPYVALGTSATFCLLAHMSRDSGAKVIFGYLTNMVAVCGMSALSAIRYFRLPPAQLLRLALVSPIDRYLKGVEARSVMPAV